MEGEQIGGLLIFKGKDISEPLNERSYNMSRKHPECPMYNHDNWREFYSPKIFAVVKEDKICLKKKGNPKSKSKTKDRNELEELTIPDGIIGNL